MRLLETSFFLFASHALAAPVDSQDGTNNPVVQDGILQLSLSTVPIEKELNATKINKRQVPAPVDNFKFDGSRPIVALGIVLEVGTPPQKVIVEPDTGSSKLWIPGLIPGQTREDTESTHFDLKQSSSARDLNQEDGSRYASEAVIMNMFTDEVSIGGVSMGPIKFGIGNMSHPATHLGRHVGTMGLLPPPDAKNNDDFILKKLLDKKLVKSRAFSIGLRKKGQGALAFGGYDTSKFSGPLEKFAVQPSKGKHYIVEVQSVLFNNGTGGGELVLDKQDVQGRPLTMGLDSGAPAFQVSVTLAKTVAQKTGGTFKGPFLHFPCDVVDAKAAIDFKMTDSTTVSVPLLDFVMGKIDNDKTCKLAVQFGGKVPADLWIGGHFLRRSLVVYDPDNSNIYVARGADCGSSLVAIDGNMPNDVVVGKCKQEAPDFDAPADKAPSTVPAIDEADIRVITEPRIDEETNI